MENRFENQIAVVTGGADGIGRQIAGRLAREGARVTLFDVDAAKAEAACGAFSAEGLTVDARVVDVADDDAVRQALESVASQNGGRLDVVVHCAAIVGPTSTRITDVSIEAFDQASAINLRGTFSITKHALRLMEPRNYGRILLFASIAGKEG
ncbi:MAG: SDR family NAD(P)-dependent oxidoreductase, partial [Verrucomicrobiae bacterium]|nr:SDR family NAD(P)-dependent oxidoreductase [Verrucomicrobiae bacterium]